MRQLYIYDQMISEDRVLKDVRKRLEEGRPSHVHYHKADVDQCNARCVVYEVMDEPEEEVVIPPKLYKHIFDTSYVEIAEKLMKGEPTTAKCGTELDPTLQPPGLDLCPRCKDLSPFPKIRSEES